LPDKPVGEIRCLSCSKKLLEMLEGKAVIKCPRCKTVGVFDTTPAFSLSS